MKKYLVKITETANEKHPARDTGYTFVTFFGSNDDMVYMTADLLSFANEYGYDSEEAAKSSPVMADALRDALTAKFWDIKVEVVEVEA